jgi:hypothetical protein
MTHLELTNLLTDYVEAALDAAQAQGVEEHLRECAPCREMLEDVRLAMAACRDAVDLEPSPWLFERIVRATIGERKPGLKDVLLAWMRPWFRPQIAYSLSMAIFSLSFILYAANVKLRSVSLQDVNPATWVYRANSRGHMLAARAEKYYYDLRLVYEVQSLFRDLRQQPDVQPGRPGGARAPGSTLNGNASARRAVLAVERAPKAGGFIAPTGAEGDE